MRRFATVLSALVVVVAACSGDDSDRPIFAPTDDAGGVAVSEVVDAEALLAIDTAIHKLGPDQAFRAVLFAIDDGYDTTQITEAMADGSLQSDGTISGATPNGPASNLIDRSGPSAHSDFIVLAVGADLALGPSTVGADDFKRAVLGDAAQIFLGVDLAAERDRDEMSREAGLAAIVVILSLTNAGYSVEQIVELVVLGNEALALPVEGNLPCLTIVDGETVVSPANAPQSSTGCTEFYEAMRKRTAETSTTTTGTAESATTTTPADNGAADGIDGTYVGDVALGVAQPDYAVVESRVEITISDGAAEVILDVTMDTGLNRNFDNVMTCSAVSRLVFAGTGAAGALLEIAIPRQSIEIISAWGDCDPLSHFEDDTTYMLAATVSNGTITGQALEGLLTVSARLVP